MNREPLTVNREPLILNPYEGGGDVGGGNGDLSLGKGDDDALLTADARQAAFDALELAIDDADQGSVTQVTAFLGVDGQQVLVLRTGGTDEVEHLGLGDDKRGVLIVESLQEVIVVIRQEGQLRGVADILLRFVGTEVGEDEIGGEHLQHLMEATVFVALAGAALRHIDIGAMGYHIVGCDVFTGVAGTEDVPLLVWGRDVFYRHPFLRTLGFGEDAGCSTSTGSCCFHSGECHIRQCIHIETNLVMVVDAGHKKSVEWSVAYSTN